jgi:glucose-6-phosphate dehydrogenase assembly protein OpcA
VSAQTNGPAGEAWTAGLTAVKVADVPVALSHRWKQIADQYPGTATRAASVNLITYTDDLRAGPVVSSIVGELAATHPIRAIVVVEEDEAASDAVESFIQSRAILARNGKPTCSEEVFLHANADSAERTASAVYGLLIADLPVYLWWRGPSPYGSGLFRLIAPFADKLIVDTQRFGDTSAALDTLRRMAEHRSGHVAVSDLNWKRIEPWRETIAACFDDPAVGATLAHLDRCEIDYAEADSAGAVAAPTARAALLAGWLSSRVPRLRHHTRLAGQPPPPGGNAGRIEAVVLSSAQTRASLSLRRVAHPLGIEACSNGTEGAEIRRWHFPADRMSEAQLLHMSLDDPARDPVFEAALNEE